MPRTSTRPLRIRALACVVLGVTVLGCDATPEQAAGPERAVETLAAALADGDLTAIGLTEGSGAEATTSLQALVEGMGDAPPDVAAGEVRENGDRATASLTWSWPVGARDWTYDTEVGLSRVGEDWLVEWAPSVVESSLAEGEALDVTPVAAPRGRIIGARGLHLVTERPVVRFGVDRSHVPRTRAVAAARRLAAVAGVAAGPYATRVGAAGDQAFVEAIVYRREEVPPRVAAAARSVPGVLAVQDELPLAPTRDFAAPLLGTVGEVTAEMVEADPDRYRPGDRAGLSGLQARYDDQLQGVPGAVVHAVTPDGAERELFGVDARRGDPLRLTLDADLQLEAESLLSDVGPASALVAIRPSTGDVVVAANGPGTRGYNTATFGQAAPGSTFKTVTSLALLRAGLSPAAPVPCPPSAVVDGKRFSNYSDYPAATLGDIALRTAVAHSCNTAFVSQADRLDDGDLADAAASLGLGVDHDLGFPAYFGSVEPATSETEAAAQLIGQGRVLASPLVMATVIASVQHGGLVVPRMVESVEVGPPDGVAPLASDEAAALRSMLRGVVTDGSGNQLADLPGPPAIAKTGTAEFESDGRLLTHAWMIGAQGDLAVAVYVEVGESGSRTAGPLLEEFLRAAR